MRFSFTASTLKVNSSPSVPNQISSEAFFQLFMAPRPFSRSQVMRLRTIIYLESTWWIAVDDLQSPQMYTEAVGFNMGRSRVNQDSSQPAYSAILRLEKVLVLKDFVKLYGGSTTSKSTVLCGNKGRVWKVFPWIIVLVTCSGVTGPETFFRSGLSWRRSASERVMVRFLPARVLVSVIKVLPPDCQHA